MLGGCDRPLARAYHHHRRRGAGRGSGRSAPDAGFGRGRPSDDQAARVRPPRATLPPLRGPRPRARSGRRQPDDILVPSMSAVNRLRRVGHKGADLIAPGNTYASFDAALEAGVDMIEFDVLPERGSGLLILAHDHRDAARREPHTLDEGLAHLASAPFDGIELDV